MAKKNAILLNLLSIIFNIFAKIEFLKIVMLMIKRSICLLFLLLLISFVNADENYIFHSYMTKQGLPSNHITSIMQDRNGYIWIGTDNGISCFDGRVNDVFKNSNTNRLKIGDNHIYTMMQDQNGVIWAGTKNGAFICRDGLNFIPFSIKTKYNVGPSSEVTSILQTSSGEVWIGTLGQGLFIFDPSERTLRQDNVNTTFINDICNIENTIYIATMSEGIAHYSISGNFVDYVKSENGEKFLDKVNRFTIANNHIWAGCDNGIVTCMSYRGKIEFSINLESYGCRNVRTIFEDYSSQGILVGTDRGIYRINNPQNEKIEVTKSSFQGTDNVAINSVCKDSEGSLWIATDNNGLIYITQRQKPFRSLQNDALKMVNAICENPKDHSIWLGCRNGLFYKEAGNNEVRQIHLNKSGGLECEIKALCLVGENLWIGTYGEGIKEYNINTGVIINHVHDEEQPNSLCSNYVTSLCLRDNGWINVGTNWGFCYFKQDTRVFHTYTSLSYTICVTDVKEDKDRNLWISTSNSGLYVLYSGELDLRHYAEGYPEDEKLPPFTNVISIYCSNGKNWFGTNGKGLFYQDQATRTFRQFKAEDNWLSSRVVYSIEEDFNGFLCIATDAGFIHLPVDESKNYQVLTSEDGLVGDNFNNGASLAASDGYLYYGETYGCDILDPALFSRNDYVPNVYISGISLLKEDNEIDEINTLNLKTAIFKTEKIKIPFESNSISFRLSSLSFQDPGKNRFSYKLDGIDANWVSDVETNTATYRNLMPGEYLFHVKGSNNDHIWNEKEARIFVIVSPPWWFSTWAIVCYIMLTIIAIGFSIYKYRQYNHQKYRMFVENYKATKEKEAYRSKIEFFTHIVHEIRTPLTLIKLPIDSIKKRKGELDSEWQSIDRNVNYLLGVVNELLDMQKIESGSIKLQTIRTDITKCLKNNCEQFKDALALKGISLEVIVPNETIEAVIDPIKISKIIVNLLGNALKYAQKKIRVELSANATDFSIHIEDDGPGIKGENREKVFQAFFQENNEQSSLGTGIGLTYSRQIAKCHQGSLVAVESSIGGAAFKLVIPRYANKETIPVDKEDSKEKVTTVETVTKQKSEESRYHILVVEDNDELLGTVTKQLKQWYNVSKALNGKEALAILETRSIDIIISDVMMPVMDGIELCQRVKSDENYSHIPIILLTAKIQLQAKLEGMEAGADIYMEKPFSIDQLHYQIENLFKLRIVFHKWMQEIASTNKAEIEQNFNTENGLSHRNYQFVMKMNAIIDKHLNEEDFSLDLLAQELNLSRSSFYRKLHFLSDVTPNDYLKNYRLNKATEMLKQGMRISEVYEAAGFCTSSYFSKCFKQKFGVLPKEFQTNYLNNKKEYHE